MGEVRSESFLASQRFSCLASPSLVADLLFLKVDRNVYLRIDNRSMKKCNFSYILHWNPDFQRRLVLENDFVRFRSREHSCRVRPEVGTIVFKIMLSYCCSKMCKILYILHWK